MDQPTLSSLPDLRPLGIGGILDRAIAIYRKDWITLISIVGIVSVPLMLIQVAAGLVALPADPSRLFSTFDSSPPSASQIAPLFAYYGVTLFTSILAAIAGIFEMGAIAVAVSQRYHRQDTSLRRAYGQALPHWLSMLGAAILIGLANLAIFGLFGLLIVGVPLAGALGTAGSSSPASAALEAILFGLFCIGLIPALLLALFVNIKWIFTQQAIVLENTGPVKGLGRSWRIVKGSFWRVLFVVILLGIFVYIITVIPSSMLSASALFLMPGSILIQTVINNVVSAAIAVFVTPLQMSVFTLLYYDLRVRKEGYDLELRAQALVPQPPALAGTGE